MFTDDEGLRKYVAAIQRFEPLDREAEQVLARRWHDHGDQEAAHQLVQSHLLFVVKIANSYKGYGLRVADLVEEGNVGVLEAVKRFDPSRNLRFLTYASYWIRAYVLGHVLRQFSLVGVGTSPRQSRLFFRLSRERARITTALGGNPAQGDVDTILARRFDTSEENIRGMSERLDGKDVSLNAQAYQGSEVTELELLTDDTQGQEERFAQQQGRRQVRHRLTHVMHELSPRERHIVEHRLLADEEASLAEIARHFGLSRERVRQIEERLKRKLREALAEFGPQPEQN